VKKLVDTGIYREKRRLVAVCEAERDDAQVIAVVDGGDAGEGASAIPMHGDVTGEDEVDDAAAQTEKDRFIARGMAYFAWAVGGLKIDAAAAERASRFGPDAPPEALHILPGTLRVEVHDTMDGHDQPRRGAAGNARRRRCPDKLATCHLLLNLLQSSAACYKVAGISTIQS
jgi:hypothetical protein